MLRFLLLPLACGLVSAQEDLARKAEQLKALVSRPPAEWDDAHAIKLSQLYLDLYLDMLWEPEQHRLAAPYLPASRPKVAAYIAGELRTPIWSGGVMRVPVEYLAHLASIGVLTGHDIFVDDHRIELPYPLLSAPFRSSRVLPLLHPLGRHFEQDRFATLQVYLVCPASQGDCQTVQNMASMAAVLFCVLHEISHGFLRHPASPTYSPAQEIAADGNALVLLDLLAGQFKSMPEPLLGLVRQSFFLAPLVWLEVEASRVSSAALRAEYEQRKKALLQVFPPDRRRLAGRFLEPKSASGSTSTLRLDWSEKPERIWIDGISVPPNDLVGRTLTVSANAHTVIAFRPGAIAFADLLSPGATTSLRFQPLPPTPPVAELESLESRQKWADILIRTTDENLKPRQPAAALYHWEALRHFRLHRLIRVEDWKAIPEPMWRRVQLWERLGQPLAAWR